MGIFDFLKSKKNSLNINEFNNNNNNERVIQVDNGFVFKTIESEDHMNIELDWLDKTVPIYIDNGNTELRTDTLYTDDSLSVFLNTETTKNANTIIESLINLNGGFSNFKKELRNGYELFYVGNKFSIGYRETIVGFYQVDIISKKELDKSKVDNNNYQNLTYDLNEDEDYLELLNFLDERPNINRIYTEFKDIIRNNFSVRQYLIEANLMKTEEVKNIVIWSFSNIIGFLEAILKKNENYEIRIDLDALVEAINILSEVKNEIDLITDKIKIELSELSDKTKGKLYDYSYWFDVVCDRAKSHSISIYEKLNNENIINLSDGHCEEYHYRMIENNDIEKTEFITPRIISFSMIYEKLLSINQSKLSSDDLSKLEVLKFHSISSLYGSIKFALEDITEGKKLVNVIYPNYIEELTSKSVNNKTEDESEESIRLFSPKVRFLLNGLIINKIQESIPQKNTSEFVNLIKLVNQILPVDNSNEINENIEIYDLINAEITLFNNEQTLVLQRLFSVLIIYSKQFLYIDLLIYVIELINKFGIEISDEIENDINETEIVFEIVERLKAKFSIFNFVETLKSRLYSGIIQNEEELFEVIANEFSIGIFLGEDEKIRNATEGLEIHIKRAFEMIGASKMIKFDVDYLATILNEHDDDRFYGFDYVENYHTIYLSIYNCLIESSGKELKLE